MSIAHRAECPSYQRSRKDSRLGHGNTATELGVQLLSQGLVLMLSANASELNVYRICRQATAIDILVPAGFFGGMAPVWEVLGSRHLAKV